MDDDRGQFVQFVEDLLVGYYFPLIGVSTVVMGWVLGNMEGRPYLGTTFGVIFAVPFFLIGARHVFRIVRRGRR